MVKEIYENTFVDAENSKYALVDFYADWCGPCQQLGPIVSELSNVFAGQVDFYKINVDEAPETCDRFGITNIPCLILLKNGEEVDRSVGFRPMNGIENWIKSKI
ncbi:MAG: thioredoxin [Clostridia bacterium]|nr:thioredoxin [Clostridia bacterium]